MCQADRSGGLSSSTGDSSSALGCWYTRHRSTPRRGPSARTRRGCTQRVRRGFPGRPSIALTAVGAVPRPRRPMIGGVPAHTPTSELSTAVDCRVLNRVCAADRTAPGRPCPSPADARRCIVSHRARQRCRCRPGPARRRPYDTQCRHPPGRHPLRSVDGRDYVRGVRLWCAFKRSARSGLRGGFGGETRLFQEPPRMPVTPLRPSALGRWRVPAGAARVRAGVW